MLTSDPILFVVIATAVGWVVLVNTFSGVMNAKAIIARGERIPFVFKGPLYVGGFVGLALDVIFNWPLGLLVFCEGPRKLTFSARVQWHVDHSRGEDLERAIWWGEQLNKFDPRHISRLAEASRRLEASKDGHG